MSDAGYEPREYAVALLGHRPSGGSYRVTRSTDEAVRAAEAQAWATLELANQQRAANVLILAQDAERISKVLGRQGLRDLYRVLGIEN